jgi:biotin operon repressor
MHPIRARRAARTGAWLAPELERPGEGADPPCQCRSADLEGRAAGRRRPGGRQGRRPLRQHRACPRLGARPRVLRAVSVDVPDPWVCRVPRADLLALAARPQMPGAVRIVAALLSQLYENLGKTGGEAAVSQPKLQRLTGLSRSTVRRSLAQLIDAGGLVEVSADAGHSKRYRLAGCSQAGHPVPLAEPPQHPKRAPYPARLVSTPPGPPYEHPREERRREELSEEKAAAVGARRTRFRAWLLHRQEHRCQSLHCELFENELGIGRWQGELNGGRSA